MKLSADRDGSIRRFTAKLGWREKFDPKEIDMLSAGAVPMLIPPIAVQGKRNHVIQFDISPYSTLEFYLSCILSREQFAELLLQCIEFFYRVQQVYLNYKNLVFDFDKIYICLNDRTVHFIYLPLMNSRREAEIPKFFREMIKKATRSTYEQSAFLDACMSWMNHPGSFVISEFESFIRSYNWGSSPSPSASVEPNQNQSHSAPVLQVCQPLPRDNWGVQTAGSPQGGTCQLVEQQGDTVLLEAGASSAPLVRFYLVRTHTEEKVELTQFPFLVGSEVGSVTYCVSGNAAVSRRHAEFSVQDGECFISDLKSTNKTYVNDIALLPHTPQSLKNGDRIRLANEDFVFIQEE